MDDSLEERKRIVEKLKPTLILSNTTEPSKEMKRASQRRMEENWGSGWAVEEFDLPQKLFKQHEKGTKYGGVADSRNEIS